MTNKKKSRLIESAKAADAISQLVIESGVMRTLAKSLFKLTNKKIKGEVLEKTVGLINMSTPHINYRVRNEKGREYTLQFNPTNTCSSDIYFFLFKDRHTSYQDIFNFYNSLEKGRRATFIVGRKIFPFSYWSELSQNRWSSGFEYPLRDIKKL